MAAGCPQGLDSCTEQTDRQLASAQFAPLQAVLHSYTGLVIIQ